MNTIFIAIAAYRDPELLATIKNCLEQAAFPERLHFGIMWQHAAEDTWDTIEEYRNHPQFKIVDVDYKLSQGVCWARHEMQKLYQGETYYLQLDSHHRFDKHWDIKLVKMLQGLQSSGHEKPLLTAYATAYTPGKEERGQEPWKLNFDRFAPDGVVHFTPGTIPNHTQLHAPIPARFLSAHYIFTLGEFCTNVPYDPEYYFHGEEISLAVRAYTHGYDLFHPHKVYIWHEYTRKDKSKHWADNNWSEKDKKAKERNRKLLGVDEPATPIETYGLGTSRTLQEYERYAGIEFLTRRVHKHTVEEKNPPTPLENYEAQLSGYKKYCIDVYRPSVSEKDYICWAVAFKDAEGNEIHREDASPEEIHRIMTQDPENKFVQIWRKFYSNVEAKSWVVWPQTHSNGWLDPIKGTL
jgi:hypothetical protein